MSETIQSVEKIRGRRVLYQGSRGTYTTGGFAELTLADDISKYDLISFDVSCDRYETTYRQRNKFVFTIGTPSQFGTNYYNLTDGKPHGNNIANSAFILLFDFPTTTTVRFYMTYPNGTEVSTIYIDSIVGFKF